MDWLAELDYVEVPSGDLPDERWVAMYSPGI